MTRRSAAGPVTDVYLTVVGQDDNLGDSILRRGLVRACSGDGARLHVAVGRHGAGYLGNLDLPAGTVTYTSNVRWVLSALRRSVRGRVAVAFAGELSGRRGLVKVAVVDALAVAARYRGGAGLLTGVGVRWARDRRMGRMLRISAATSSLTAWRDQETARLVGRGRFVPDWAFGEGGVTDPGIAVTPREVLAVSVRGDRPAWSAAAVRAVGQVAAARGLRVVVYAQVRQDNDACRLLADRLGAEALVWEGTDHAAHERAVRALGRRSELVAGDRLHGLVVGMTEGATPCALAMDTIEKVDRTLTSVGLPEFAHCLRGRSDADIRDLLDRALARRPEVAEALDRARTQVLALRNEVRAVLAGGTRPRGGPAPGPVRVLLALAPPDGTTRYVDQVCSELPGDIRVGFFSWPRALLWRYDVLHLHWPEHFLRTRPSVTRAGSYLAFGALYLRTARSRVAVVRTLHNVDPHDAVHGARSRALLERWDARTDHYIRINPVTPIRPDRPTHTVLHGHYRDRFAGHRVQVADANRLLYFGLLRPYKGVERLLEVFSGAGSPSCRLRIVGRPVDAEVADAVRRAEAADPRITARLDFVSDEEAVREITSAWLVVLPYREMHNSGVVLVALSLGRPVLVPRSPATEALAREVGPGWVCLFDGPLTWEAVHRARDDSRTRLAPPALDRRDWATVGRGHAAVYREAARDRRERHPADEPGERGESEGPSESGRSGEALPGRSRAG